MQQLRGERFASVVKAPLGAALFQPQTLITLHSDKFGMFMQHAAQENQVETKPGCSSAAKL